MSDDESASKVWELDPEPAGPVWTFGRDGDDRGKVVKWTREVADHNPRRYVWAREGSWQKHAWGALLQYEAPVFAEHPAATVLTLYAPPWTAVGASVRASSGSLVVDLGAALDGQALAQTIVAAVNAYAENAQGSEQAKRGRR